MKEVIFETAHENSRSEFQEYEPTHIYNYN